MALDQTPFRLLDIPSIHTYHACLVSITPRQSKLVLHGCMQHVTTCGTTCTALGSEAKHNWQLNYIVQQS